MFQAAGDTLRIAGKFFLDFFVLCGLVRTNTHTFGDPLQNPDKTAPNWQIFVRTKLATCLANITIYTPGPYENLEKMLRSSEIKPLRSQAVFRAV